MKRTYFYRRAREQRREAALLLGGLLSSVAGHSQQAEICEYAGLKYSQGATICVFYQATLEVQGNVPVVDAVFVETSCQIDQGKAVWKNGRRGCSTLQLRGGEARPTWMEIMSKFGFRPAAPVTPSN